MRSLIHTLLAILIGVQASGQISFNPDLRQCSFGSTLLPHEEDPYEMHRMNAAYVELFGNALSYSFNYDFRFRNSSDGPGARLGVGALALGGLFHYTIPVQVNWLLGSDGQYFEVGAGATVLGGGIFGYDEATELIGTLTFGYRRQPIDGGFLFRIGLTPFFGNLGGEFIFWPIIGGLSFGYAFPSKAIRETR